MGLLKNVFGSSGVNPVPPGTFQEVSRLDLQNMQSQLGMQSQLAQNQLGMQSQLAQNQLGMQNAYNTAAQGIYGGPFGVNTQPSLKRFDPNENEAYQIPLSQLVTMWQVKYGDKWAFTGDDKKWDDFYVAAEARLQLAGLFENVQGWVRLKENVEKLLADR